MYVCVCDGGGGGGGGLLGVLGPVVQAIQFL